MRFPSNVQQWLRLCYVTVVHTLAGRLSVTVTATVTLVYVDGELVLLVAAHVRVAHEEQRVAVFAGRRRDELEPHLGLLLQRQPLDGHKVVHFHVADHDPPTLLAFLQRGSTKPVDHTYYY